MPVKILFVSHATTLDNETDKSSGWFDVCLSPLGYQQAHEMGERNSDRHIDAIFCSDLQRSYLSAEIGFAGRITRMDGAPGIPIFRDARLREIDYGDLTRADTSLTKQKTEHIEISFPNGESYTDSNARMKDFLDELCANYDGKTVLVVGHRATQYALEHFILGIPMTDVVAAKFKWQPWWEYSL